MYDKSGMGGLESWKGSNDNGRQYIIFKQPRPVLSRLDSRHASDSSSGILLCLTNVGLLRSEARQSHGSGVWFLMAREGLLLGVRGGMPLCIGDTAIMSRIRVGRVLVDVRDAKGVGDLKEPRRTL